MNGQCVSAHAKASGDAGTERTRDAAVMDSGRDGDMDGDDAAVRDAQTDAGSEATAAAICDGAASAACWKDADEDGYAKAGAAMVALRCGASCPAGFTSREPTADDVDCDDGDAKLHPRRCWRDPDMDGYAADALDVKTVCVETCGAGWTGTEPKGNAIDCKADSDAVAPGVAESCNGKDDDCDHIVDEEADSACEIENGTGQCVMGSCAVGSCNAGFGDCDSARVNGCEQALDTADNCGGCGITCDLLASCAGSNASAQCACQMPSFGDGQTCHSAGPLSAGTRWTCIIDQKGKVTCLGEQQSGLVMNLPTTTSFRQVATGAQLGIGCGITYDQRLVCWSPPLAPTDAQYVQVVAGEEVVCGLTTEGNAVCWGVGAGANAGEAPAPAGSFTQLAAGRYHVCGLQTDGTALCWGAGSFARSTNCFNTADVHIDCAQAQPPSDTFVQVTAGAFHSCGLKADGSVKCWGLGATTTGDASAPDYGQARPPEGESFAWISAGAYHTCAIRSSDGHAVCWGAGRAGQTGTYDDGQSNPPDDVFLTLSAGELHTCGLTDKYDIVCWGDNNNGKAPALLSGSYPYAPGLQTF